MPFLYIISTPIGNLNDISLRAIKTLKEVDLVLCEDTRRTKKLLNHYKINTPTLSYHQHSKLKKINYIIDLLRQGKDLALVSDAGTPGISDPGNKLVEVAIKSLDNKIRVVPIPGPSAVIAALSVSGLPTDKFLFLGFPPVKKKRKKFLKEVIESKYSVVFYESPYRIIRTLEDLKKILDIKDKIPNIHIVVCREMTKIFETIYRGRIDKVIEEIQKDKIKGEFVVITHKE